MSPYVAALTGVSGVGKSTFLRKLAAQLTFQHLQASALIKEGRQAAEGGSISLDQLRGANLDQNQRLLIEGFRIKADPRASVIVLDGHSLIERDGDLVPIDPYVFGAVRIARMIFLADDPAAIAARRLADTNRERLIKDAQALQAVQEAAREHAEKICLHLNVAFDVLYPSQLDDAERLLRLHECS
jgi:adenylate kinase